MHRPSFFSLPFVAAILCTALVAQQRRTALSLLPERAQLLIQIDGPARIAEAFKDTNLAKMLNGEQLGGLIRKGLKKGNPQLTGVLAMLGYKYRKVRDAVLGFRGRLSIAAWMDLTKLLQISDIDDFGKQHMWVAFILSPEKTSSVSCDLKSLVKKLNRTAERRVPRLLEDLELEGRSFRSYKIGDANLAWKVTLPFMLEGHAVMLISNKIEKTLASMLTTSGGKFAELERKLEHEYLAMYLDTVAFWRLIFRSLHLSGDVADRDQAGLRGIRLMGVEHMQSLLVTASPLGPYVAAYIHIALANTGKGILDAILGPGTVPDSALDFIPKTALAWEIYHSDPKWLWEYANRLFKGVFAEQGRDWHAMLAEFEADWGLKVADDIIPHLGGEFFVLNRSFARTETGGVGGAIALELKDASKFKTSLMKIIKERGLDVDAKKSKHAGYEILVSKCADGSEFQLAITERFVLLSIGAKNGQIMRDFIDTELALKKGREPVARPAALMKRLGYLNGYRQGYMAVRMPAVLALLEELAESSFDPDIEAEQGKGLGEAFTQGLQLIKDYGLEQLVEGCGLDASQFRARFIW